MTYIRYFGSKGGIQVFSKRWFLQVLARARTLKKLLFLELLQIGTDIGLGLDLSKLLVFWVSDLKALSPQICHIIPTKGGFHPTL